MKRQIRKSVFETNSSSTHSLQIVKPDEAQKIVFETIKEKLQDSFGIYGGDNDKRDFIDYNTLILRGFIEESGNESSLVANIISDPIIKIQYIFSLLYRYLKVTYFFRQRGEYEYERERVPETLNENAFIEQTQEYGYFKDSVLNYLKNSDDYSCITSLKFDENKVEVWNEETPYDYQDCATKDKFMKMFNDIMDDDKSILLMDEPYNMYGTPNIIIY